MRSEAFSAAKLAALRKRKGMSQRDLAKLVSISQAQVAELERGRRQPTLEVADRIASALGVPLSELSSA